MEIEIRSIITNIHEFISNIITEGFVEIDNYEQIDIIFDRHDASLFKSGQKIRLRIEKEIAEVTYKGLFQGDETASRRVEINIPINHNQSDLFITFLEAIGYPSCFRIEKRRSLYKKEDIAITIDQWPIIGYLAEIEGPESGCKDLAKKIAPSADFKNYRLKELFQNEVKRTGKSIFQLKKEYEALEGKQIGKIELLLD